MVPSEWYQENMYLKIQPLQWCKYTLTLNSIPGRNTDISVRKMRQKRNYVLSWEEKKKTKCSNKTLHFNRTAKNIKGLGHHFPHTTTEHEGDWGTHSRIKEHM